MVRLFETYGATKIGFVNIFFNSIFCQKFNILPEIQYFLKKLNFGQKFNVLSKIRCHNFCQNIEVLATIFIFTFFLSFYSFEFLTMILNRY